LVLVAVCVFTMFPFRRFVFLERLP